jgi:putative spermidine/putrescine transport system permease protein
MFRKSGSRFSEKNMRHVKTTMMRQIPLVLAWLTAIFLAAPIAIIVPMSFSSAISFEFPPPGYWTGYYAQYFSSHSWLEATANSFIIAFGTMAVTLIVALPAAFASCATASTARARSTS